MFGRKGLNKGAEPAPQGQPGDIKGPLFNAVQYLSLVSPPNTPGDRKMAGAVRAHSPALCSGPGNMTGCCILFDCENGGTGKAFLFPTFGSVWIDGEASPRVQIPTEMIANQVQGYEQALREILSR
jgi:hypothetical protein